MAENLSDNDWSEHYIKKGDPSAPTYYIIRREGAHMGIISYYVLFAGHIKYALSKHYIPVIDMQNYPNFYLESKLLGKENSWEYFFKQPFSIGIEQAYKGENVILSATGALDNISPLNNELYNQKSILLAELRTLVRWGLLEILPDLQKEIDELYNKLFSPNDRVLGVSLRGTDYKTLMTPKHHIPPPLEYVLPKVIMRMRDWKCNKIFLATEDMNIVKNFKSVFGELCITAPRKYVKYSYAPVLIGDYRKDEKDQLYLSGKEYIMDIALLAKCNSFVYAGCSGSAGAMIMGKNFENVYFVNIGRNGVLALEDFFDD